MQKFHKTRINLDAVKQCWCEESHEHRYWDIVPYCLGGVTTQLYSVACYKERNSSLYVRIINLSSDFFVNFHTMLIERVFQENDTSY